MAVPMKSLQRGVSLLGMLLVVAVVVIVATVGLIYVRAEVEHRDIQRAVDKAGQEATVPAAKMTFDKAADIDGIVSLTSNDLQIVREGERFVVRYAYQRESHLAGPLYMVLKFSGQSK